MKYEIKRIEIVDSRFGDQIKDWAPEDGQTVGKAFSIIEHSQDGDMLTLHFNFLIVLSPSGSLDEHVMRFYIKMDIKLNAPIAQNVLRDADLLPVVALGMVQTATRCGEIFSRVANENGTPPLPSDTAWEGLDMFSLIEPVFANYPTTGLGMD